MSFPSRSVLHMEFSSNASRKFVSAFALLLFFSCIVLVYASYGFQNAVTAVEIAVLYMLLLTLLPSSVRELVTLALAGAIVYALH